MGLKYAANYFTRTPIYGLNGSSFVDTGVKGDLQTYDRFISEREFGNKRRMLLVNPETPIPSQYSVIRLGLNGPIYLVGNVNQDIYANDTYSLVYLVLITKGMGQLIELQRTAKASGFAATTTDHSLGFWYCDTERLTFSNSPNLPQNRISEVLVTLPFNCPINQDHEFILGNQRFVSQEVYPVAGFIQARTQVKNV